MLVTILIAILLAALGYWLCALLGLPFIVCVIVAILILVACIGGGPRLGGRRGDGV